MKKFTVQTETQKIELETKSGVYLAFKQTAIEIINADIVESNIKKADSSKLSELGKYIEAERLEFVEMSEEYTLLSDEEGLHDGNTIYSIEYEGKTFYSPGDFIVARLSSAGNAIPLTEEDVALLDKKLKVMI